MRVEITSGGEVRRRPRSASPARACRWRCAVEFKNLLPGMPRSCGSVEAALRPEAHVGIVRDRDKPGLVARGLVDDVARADHRGP